MERPTTGIASQWETQERAPGCIVVRVTGEIDASLTDRFQEHLLAALPAASERLVVDLSDVTFFDSAGIRCLITLRQRAAERLNRLRLIMPSRPAVRRALEISALHRLFIVADDVSAALAPAPSG